MEQTLQPGMDRTRVTNCRIDRFEEHSGWCRKDDIVIRETCLRIVDGSGEIARLSCMPGMEKELTCGHLFGLCRIGSAEDLLAYEFRADNGEAVVTLAGNPAADTLPTPLEGPFPPISPGMIISASMRLQQSSGLFRATGGVHSVMLCSHAGDTIVLVHDIGRYNALEKIVGFCLLNRQIGPRDCFILCAGRVPGDVVLKAWRLGIPVIVSRSATTSHAVELARQANIALIAFARDGRFNLYHGADRIPTDTI